MRPIGYGGIRPRPTSENPVRFSPPASRNRSYDNAALGRRTCVHVPCLLRRRAAADTAAGAHGGRGRGSPKAAAQNFGIGGARENRDSPDLLDTRSGRGRDRFAPPVSSSHRRPTCHGRPMWPAGRPDHARMPPGPPASLAGAALDRAQSRHGPATRGPGCRPAPSCPVQRVPIGPRPNRRTPKTLRRAGFWRRIVPPRKPEEEHVCGRVWRAAVSQA